MMKSHDLQEQWQMAVEAGDFVGSFEDYQEHMSEDEYEDDGHDN
jgi:hypothetical protein